MPLDKEQLKLKIQELITKLDKLKESGKSNSYTEEDTKKGFIEPLFKALGWNFEDKEEVSAEERISKNRVDYALRINGIPKLFIEAKAIKEDLVGTNKYHDQAISYAWHKGCNWAVLTDFEELLVFNAEWESKNILQSTLFNIYYTDYLKEDNLDKLLFLSRDSLEKGELDKYAESIGKKTKRIPIDKQLLGDLTTFRDKLTQNIQKNTKIKISENELDEAVQRIIDRLIFIRTLEDRTLEPPMLRSIIRENKQKKTYTKLIELFRKIDDIYNSKLFEEHLCEQLDIDDNVLETVINGLYKPQNSIIEYDFSLIDADVLGNIYEQYLGHILKKTEKSSKLLDGKTHRKEQGIYYTPTYIVDYIVKNTIGEILKDKKKDINKIRILDPACGSGSFLIKAYDYLIKEQQKRNKEYFNQTKLDVSESEVLNYTKKLEILKNNIFGVDLDEKAVEIAQLNLLLKSAEKKQRLPILKNNIKVGNSLIDDPQIAGDKAFKWEQEFPEIMTEGGFDVVIGNPPYVRQESIKELKPYFEKKYLNVYTGTADLYVYFFEQGLNILKEKGYFGFIVSNKFMRAKYGQKLRKYIQNNFKIIQIIDKFENRVFKEALVDPCIIILQKQKPEKNHQIIYNYTTNVFQNNLSENGWVLTSQDILDIKKKIETIGTPLKDWDVNIFRGITTGFNQAFIIDTETKNKILSNCKTEEERKRTEEIIKPILRGKDIKRYYYRWARLSLIYVPWHFPLHNDSNISGSSKKAEEQLRTLYPSLYEHLSQYKKELSGRNKDETGIGYEWYALQRCAATYYNEFEKEKIVWNRITDKIIFSYVASNYFILDSTFMITGKNLKYLIALLNSNIMAYWIKLTAATLGEGSYGAKIYIENSPIISITSKTQDIAKELENYVDKMISLNKHLNEIGDKKTDERARIEEEIKKTDNEIDELVYKIYGITEKEKKIIEESLK